MNHGVEGARTALDLDGYSLGCGNHKVEFPTTYREISFDDRGTTTLQEIRGELFPHRTEPMRLVGE